MPEWSPAANRPALEAPSPPHVTYAQPSPIYPGAFPVNLQLVPGPVAAPQLPEHTGPLPRSFTRQGKRIAFSSRVAFYASQSKRLMISSPSGSARASLQLDTRRARLAAYTTPDSVLDPLEKFFLILNPTVPSDSDIPSLFQIAAMQYVAFLTEIAAGYRRVPVPPGFLY